MLGFVIGVIIGGLVSYMLTRRWAKRKAVTWFVQPAPRHRRARMATPDPNTPTVSESVFVRTNLPGSTSEFN